VPARLACVVRVAGSSRQAAGTIVDISLGGARACLPVGIPVGAVVDIDIASPLLRLRGRVVRVVSSWRCDDIAVRFDSTSPAADLTLRTLVAGL
jgi:hypothetical protein